jgi:hypothetical protein
MADSQTNYLEEASPQTCNPTATTVREGSDEVARVEDGLHSDDVCSSSEYVSNEMFKTNRRKKSKATNRVQWTINEVAELKKYLKVSFEIKVTPGRTACEKAKSLSRKNGGELQRREWPKIVKKVSNMLAKDKEKEKSCDSD